jgi:toxin ParE1/3/4
MVRLDYSADAVADIDEIIAFSVEHFGRDATDAYLTGLEATCAKLAIYPEMAAIYPRIRPEIRCLTYRSHRIFYRFSTGTVMIVRVLHHAQDVKRAVI